MCGKLFTLSLHGCILTICMMFFERSTDRIHHTRNVKSLGENFRHCKHPPRSAGAVTVRRKRRRNTTAASTGDMPAGGSLLVHGLQWVFQRLARHGTLDVSDICCCEQFQTHPRITLIMICRRWRSATVMGSGGALPDLDQDSIYAALACSRSARHIGLKGE